MFPSLKGFDLAADNGQRWPNRSWKSGFHPSKGSTSQLTDLRKRRNDLPEAFPSLKGFDLAADLGKHDHNSRLLFVFPSLKGFDLAADSPARVPHCNAI